MESLKNLELSKFPEVDEVDREIIKEIFVRFLSKVNVSEDDLLHVSVKDYAKGGLRKQHEVMAKLSLAGKSFNASETNWQLIKTIQNVLKKLEKEVLKSTSN